MANRYWVAGTGNWSDATNHWATTSGGLPGAGNLPTAADDVIFDTLSSLVAYTVTIDATTKLCNNLTFGAPLTGDVTWAGSTAMTISGSMTLYSGLIRTYTGALTFNATSTGKTITSNGVGLASSITFNGTGGEWTLVDEIDVGSNAITITRGSFQSGNQTINAVSIFSQNSNVRTINFGSSDIFLNGTINFFPSTNLTFNAGTSTIKIILTTNDGLSFNGGGLTYYNLWYSRGASTGTNTILGSNTFNDLTDDGTAAHSLHFIAGTTQTFTTFDVSGTAGNLITIDSSSSTATHALVKSGGGTISCEYLNIQHSVATPGSTWYATNSTDNQAVATSGSGWIITAPAPGGNTSNFFAFL